MPAGHLGHEIGGGGRDDDEVGVAREPDMADVEFGAGVEQVECSARSPAMRADRQRRHELLRRLGHHARTRAPRSRRRRIRSSDL